MSLGGAGTAEAGCPLVSLVSERWLHRTNERMRGRTRGGGGAKAAPSLWNSGDFLPPQGTESHSCQTQTHRDTARVAPSQRPSVFPTRGSDRGEGRGAEAQVRRGGDPDDKPEGEGTSRGVTAGRAWLGGPGGKAGASLPPEILPFWPSPAPLLLLLTRTLPRTKLKQPPACWEGKEDPQS